MAAHEKLAIAVIGGTGALGSALAGRWASAGHSVIIGSRTEVKAAEAARAIGPSAQGRTNREAADACDLAVLTVPFANHAAIIADIRGSVQGKIVVDATAPLVPPKVGTVQLPPEDSAAKAAQDALGSEVRVVSAFQNVAAHKLAMEGPVDCDVLVCGDNREARETVVGLVEALGMRGLHAGPLANSSAAEALTSVLISINRHYKVQGAGIRITGNLDGVPSRTARVADAED